MLPPGRKAAELPPHTTQMQQTRWGCHGPARCSHNGQPERGAAMSAAVVACSRIYGGTLSGSNTAGATGVPNSSEAGEAAAWCCCMQPGCRGSTQGHCWQWVWLHCAARLCRTCAATQLQCPEGDQCALCWLRTRPTSES
jgi:hypothetical protein